MDIRFSQIDQGTVAGNASGYLDAVASAVATGWCLRKPADQDPSYVVLRIDDVVFAPILSNQRYDTARSDEVLPMDGYVGFAFEIPRRFVDGKRHSLRAYVAGTGQELAGSPRRFQLRRAVEGPVVRRAIEFCEKAMIVESILGGEDRFACALERGRRLALCCSYFSSASYGPHHAALFGLLRANGFVVVNVHALGASKLEDPHCGERIDYAIIKSNTGYDFGSWKIAVTKTAERWPRLEKIVFVNDSCIGPIAPNVGSFMAFLERQETLFGLTDSYEGNYHVQSYFFGVGRDPESRDLLLNFFLTLDPASDKSQAIAAGELALGARMLERGIEPAILCPYDQVQAAWMAELPDMQRELARFVPSDEEQRRKAWAASYGRFVGNVAGGNATNPAHLFWRTLVGKFRHPFIKRELLLKNPLAIPDHALIMQHLRTHCPETYRQAIQLARNNGGNLFPVTLPPPAADAPAG